MLELANTINKCAKLLHSFFLLVVNLVKSIFLVYLDGLVLFIPVGHSDACPGPGGPPGPEWHSNYKPAEARWVIALGYLCIHMHSVLCVCVCVHRSAQTHANKHTYSLRRTVLSTLSMEKKWEHFAIRFNMWTLINWINLKKKINSKAFINLNANFNIY